MLSKIITASMSVKRYPTKTSFLECTDNKTLQTVWFIELIEFNRVIHKAYKAGTSFMKK